MSIDEEVTLTFNFSEPRLFYHMDVHTNNMFTKDVQVIICKAFAIANTCKKCVSQFTYN